MSDTDDENRVGAILRELLLKYVRERVREYSDEHEQKRDYAPVLIRPAFIAIPVELFLKSLLFKRG